MYSNNKHIKRCDNFIYALGKFFLSFQELFFSRVRKLKEKPQQNKHKENEAKFIVSYKTFSGKIIRNKSYLTRPHGVNGRYFSLFQQVWFGRRRNSEGDTNQQKKTTSSKVIMCAVL
jgi:hypothetical protein